MTTRPSVLVLMGGPDAERPVSIMSGTGVAAALRESGKFDVIERTIDKPTAQELAAMPGEVIFPVLHGHWGEGGPLQQLLEAIGRPFVGCGSHASAFAMDKMRTKQYVESQGVRTPKAAEIGPHDHCPVDPPVVVKPVDDGSSVDIRICRTPIELAEARKQLHPRRRRLMVEQYIAGREMTVGIIHGELLPAIEIMPTVSFYDYDAKYDRDDTRYVVGPDIPDTLLDEMNRDSMIAWEGLGCRDLARVDFRVDAEGRSWFLEINTMPGFTSHSLVPMAAAKHGWSMPALCAKLVEHAMARADSGTQARAAV